MTDGLECFLKSSMSGSYCSPDEFSFSVHESDSCGEALSVSKLRLKQYLNSLQEQMCPTILSVNSQSM